MPVGSTPCFPCVPGVGWQLKVQTETHSLSSEIRGFVCSAQQELLTVRELAQRRRMTPFFNATFAITAMLLLQNQLWRVYFSFVHLLVQDR